MRPSTRTILYALALGLSWSVFSCGGGDGDGSPTPPAETGQTVLVQVSTTGEDLDPDGYTVRLGARSATVAPTGTATFDDVSAGTYQVSLEGVAANCTVQGGVTRSVSVTGTSGAQTSFTVTCVIDFGDGLTTVACTSLTLAATSGVPLDRVPAGSVPPTLNPPLAARVLADDGDLVGFTWLENSEAGDLELMTPLHPAGSIDGGQVLIRVTDGNSACEPFEFTVDPLPASPGELGEVVDRLQDILRTQAALLETTPEELTGTTPEDLPQALLPLAVIQYVLDHPENPRSLRRVADGTSQEGVPLDLVEALLARTELREELEGHLVAVQAPPHGRPTRSTRRNAPRTGSVRMPSS